MYPKKRVFLLSRKYLFMVGILAALFITVLSIWFYQAIQPKQVEFVHNGKSKVVATKAKTVGEFLQQQNVQRDSYDILNPQEGHEIEEGTKITYKDRWQVALQEGDRQQDIITDQHTVQGILQEQHIRLGEWDRIEPAVTASIAPNQKITIIRVEKEVVEKKQTVAFNEVTRKDYSLAQGQKKVLQEGQEGQVLERFEVVYENGQEKSRSLIDSKIIRRKQDRMVAIGTMLTVSRGGSAFSPRKTLSNVTLTAYSAGASHTGKNADHPQYGITASGKRAEEGRTIAVDPGVIPLGTWVYIEGIGFRRAEDTGGAVKGNKIDVYYEDDRSAVNFGMKRSKAVYVIGRNKPQ